MTGNGKVRDLAVVPVIDGPVIDGEIVKLVKFTDDADEMNPEEKFDHANQWGNEAARRQRITNEAYIEMGLWLQSAKKELGHGPFMKYVETYFNHGSHDTANNYMLLADYSERVRNLGPDVPMRVALAEIRAIRKAEREGGSDNNQNRGGGSNPTPFNEQQQQLLKQHTKGQLLQQLLNEEEQHRQTQDALNKLHDIIGDTSDEDEDEDDGDSSITAAEWANELAIHKRRALRARDLMSAAIPPRAQITQLKTEQARFICEVLHVYLELCRGMDSDPDATDEAADE